MKNIFNFQQSFFSFLVVGLLAACQSTSTGIGGAVTTSTPTASANNFSSTSQTTVKQIEVLDLSYEEAVALSFDAMNSKYPNQVQLFPGSGIAVSNRSFWQGDAQALIQPVLVRNNDTQELGVIFKAEAEGVGSNFSMIPSYLSNNFFQALGNLVNERNIQKKTFTNYTELQEKGIADTVPASIPTEYGSFAEFIDNKSNLSPFEGIWEDSTDGAYVLGIYRDKGDSRSPYKAFIIESKRPLWKSGEIKIKFSKLDNSGLAMGKYHMSNKAAIKVTFESSPGGLISIAPAELADKIIYIKTYPREEETFKKGTGSGWHAGNGLIVTNAHVIDGANEILVRINGNKTNAKALTVNQKLDLAVLKITDLTDGLPAIKIRSDYDVGEQIFAIGYPLGDILGKTPKITDGIISADEGVNSDPTLFTISAPIQPGNSGGPLLDKFGNAVGVIVAKLRNQVSSDGDVENVNYAVKSSYLLPLLKKHGLENAPEFSQLENVCKEKCSAVVYIETK